MKLWVLFHSLFPWQLSLRERRGFSRRQSTAAESLFTAGLKLIFTDALLQHHPRTHVYFHPSHHRIRLLYCTVHNYSLHGDAGVQVQVHPLDVLKCTNYGKQRPNEMIIIIIFFAFTCERWNLHACTPWKIFLKVAKERESPKNNNTQKKKCVQVRLQCAWRLIRRGTVRAHHTLLVHRAHNEAKADGKATFSTGW